MEELGLRVLRDKVEKARADCQEAEFRQRVEAYDYVLMQIASILKEGPLVCSNCGKRSWDQCNGLCSFCDSNTHAIGITGHA